MCKRNYVERGNERLITANYSALGLLFMPFIVDSHIAKGFLVLRKCKKMRAV